MYFAKMLRFNKEKRKMMGYIIISTISLVTFIFLSCFMFFSYESNVNWYTYLLDILFLSLSIISLVLWHDNMLKQYKLVTLDLIDMEKIKSGKNEYVEDENRITQSEIFASGKKKLAILLIVFTIILVLAIGTALVNNVLKTNNEEFEENKDKVNYVDESKEDVQKQMDEYEYFSDENNGTLIQMKAPFRDQYIIEIYKTNDAGKTWNKIKTNLSQVYVGTTCIFLNENVGFIHDPHGGVDSYASLLITTDGGYTWNDVKVNKPDIITENNIFFKDLPKQEDNKLTVIAYTVRLNRDPNKRYYEFESKDLGKKWDFVKELEY